MISCERDDGRTVCVCVKDPLTVTQHEVLSILASNCNNDDDLDAKAATTTAAKAPRDKNAVIASIPPVVPKHGRNIPLAVGIMVGDSFHNLSDDFFLGTAFLLCSKSLAWTIVATTVCHETV